MGLCVVRHASRTSEPLRIYFQESRIYPVYISFNVCCILVTRAFSNHHKHILHSMCPASPPLAVPPRPTDSFHKYFQRSRHSRCSSQPTFLLKLPAFSPRALCSHHHNLQFFQCFLHSRKLPHTLSKRHQKLSILTIFSAFSRVARMVQSSLDFFQCLLRLRNPRSLAVNTHRLGILRAFPAFSQIAPSNPRHN